MYFHYRVINNYRFFRPNNSKHMFSPHRGHLTILQLGSADENEIDVHFLEPFSNNTVNSDMRNHVVEKSSFSLIYCVRTSNVL